MLNLGRLANLHSAKMQQNERGGPATMHVQLLIDAIGLGFCLSKGGLSAEGRRIIVGPKDTYSPHAVVQVCVCVYVNACRLRQ